MSPKQIVTSSMSGASGTACSTDAQRAPSELALFDPQIAGALGIVTADFLGSRLLEDGYLVPLDMGLLGCAQLVGCRSS